MVLSFSTDQAHQTLVRRLQQHLELDPRLHAYNVIYGTPSTRHDIIAVVTRSMLGIFAQIGAQANVPAEDVARGRTLETLIDFPSAARSAILVQNGDIEPASSYSKIDYRGHWFWVADDDYASKIAFTIVQILEALAQSTSGSQAPIVTIPTN